MSDAATAPPTGAAAPCAVKLPIFEGPLDLLLHLIRANEVDITDIPIARISEQYLEYLELMRMLDIDVASDYLVMAATLAYIKSRMLLPHDAESDEEEGHDPRAELARRLAEYAIFREAAQDLGGRRLLGRDVFTGIPDRSGLPEPDTVLEGSLWGLLEAMRGVLRNLPAEDRHHEILRESITVPDRMMHVMALLERQELALRFEDLLRDGPLTRWRVVVTFLAILELAKIQALRIFQNSHPNGLLHGPVRIRAAVPRSGPAPRQEED